MKKILNSYIVIFVIKTIYQWIEIITEVFGVVEWSEKKRRNCYY